MNSLAFAWRSLVRQPARAVLAVAGITAVGALLFDMLLLSRGLLISFRDLLDTVEFDVRITATQALPTTGPPLTDASSTGAGVEALSEIDVVIPVRMTDAIVRGPRPSRRFLSVSMIGTTISDRHAWTVIEGDDLDDIETNGPPPILINPYLAEEMEIVPGETLRLSGDCGETGLSVMPAVDYVVAGVAEFPFDSDTQMSAALTLPDFGGICGDADRDEADLLLVASHPNVGANAAVEAIQQAFPGVYAFSNEQLVDRFQRVGFTYFRQISTVLAFVTLFFTFLLVTVLQTVSVNQRYAEIAALRALGFSKRRIAADLLWESGLIVGAGGALALPLGLGLAVWLDSILRAMPAIPADLHFFVFQPGAVALHVGLLAVAAMLAAVYPIHLAANLPMASTLRNEFIG